MPHYEATMSSKGQVTVPAKVREFFELKDGDRLDFYVDPQRRSVRIIARNKPIAELAGILRTHVVPGAPPLSTEDIDSAVGDHLAEKHQRISREWNEWREFQNWKKTRAAE